VIKLLLIPAYRSTDIEVHRNWLAITHSTPISQWYYEDTSEWTLDYPPFFAYFEWILSQFAQFFDKNMLVVKNLNYASHATILFQRLSVIVTDLVFFFSIKKFTNQWTGYKNDHVKRSVVLLITFLNAGLFIVDHIHFQYNGFLFGLFIYSIAYLLQGEEIKGAFIFAALLNFKHIFLYVAPIYFVYLLKYYCIEQTREGTRFKFVNFIKLGVTVGIVFAASLGPFIYMNQIPQLLSRLFPFKRGLVHAYWAPNFWALYIFADKLLYIIVMKYQIPWLKVAEGIPGGMTGGLVGGDQSFYVLPNVLPIHTMVLTVASMLPIIFKLFSIRDKSALRTQLVPALVLIGLCSFMFGWHVHEKAILMVILPLSLIALENAFQSRMFVVLSTVGHYSLFPLLFLPSETPIKISLLLFHGTMSYAFIRFAAYVRLTHQPRLNIAERLLLIGLIAVQIFFSVVHPLLYKQLEFLPLLITSVYCALGVTYFWAVYYVKFMRFTTAAKD
jgi:alpha-1,3-glucosyltransferase